MPDSNGHAGGEVDLMGVHTPPAASAPAPAPAGGGDLVDFLGFGDPAPAAAAPASPPANSPPFSPSVSMSGDEYQNTWGGINDSESLVTMVPLQAVPKSADEVEAKLAKHNIMTMASGELPAEFKFFLYAKEASSGALVLIQGNLEKQGEALLVLTVKISGGDGAAGQAKVDKLAAVMTTALA